MNAQSKIFLLVVALALGACGGSDADPDADDGQSATTNPPAPPTTAQAGEEPANTVPPPDLGGTSWIVTHYRLPDGSITNVWKTEVTIAFDSDGVLSGSSGCNDYTAQWSVSGAYDEFEDGVRDANDGQGITFENLSWTERACDDDAVMEQETEILDLLAQAGRFVIIREELNIRDADGAWLFTGAGA